MGLESLRLGIEVISRRACNRVILQVIDARVEMAGSGKDDCATADSGA